jgi:hypothetical protein
MTVNVVERAKRWEAWVGSWSEFQQAESKHYEQIIREKLTKQTTAELKVRRASYARTYQQSPHYKAYQKDYQRRRRMIRRSAKSKLLEELKQ